MDPILTGLMLIYLIEFQNQMIEVFRQNAFISSKVVSFERCLNVTRLPEANIMRVDMSQYPNFATQGEIKFINYSTRYRSDTDLVLNRISLCISPGEKIGIVGRTGAGKSTI